MLINYIKLSLRNLRRNKAFTAINILGLATGLAACLLIVAWVKDEASYDRYAARAKDIYRVNLGVTGTTHMDYPMVDNAVGPGMAAAYPEIESFTRLCHLGDAFIQFGTRQFKESNLVFVDSNFFSIFTLPFLEGDSRTALVKPNSLVVTKAVAEKYFGPEPALGKTVALSDYGPCTITGVIDKIPDAGHFHFDAFLSWSSIHFRRQYTWTNLGYYTYLQLRPGSDARRLQKQFPGLVAKYAVPEIARDMGIPLAEASKATSTFVFTLTPLTDIHLHSDTKYELEANGSSRYVFIFSALAIFILLLACANFTNLSTAGAAARGKEVGIRKVMGSAKRELIAQFLTESVILTAFSMVLAIGFVFLLLPYFNQVSGKHFTFGSFLNFPSLAAALLLIILVGAAAGIYPAFFLSSFNPIKVLKGSPQGSRRSLLRSGLVVFQFFVSIALIIATLIVYRQLHFMQDIRLGYDKDQVVYIQDAFLLAGNQEAFRQQLLEDRRVANASISWCVPGSSAMNGTEIYPKSDGPGNGHELHINIFNVDYDYVTTLGLQVVKGRSFSRDFPTDSASGVLINETAATDLGWDHTDPIGKVIVRSGRQEFKVVGVLRDFHYQSAKLKIAPLMLLLGHNEGGIIAKIHTTDVSGFLANTKQRWEGFHASGPFSYYFLDERFANLYTAEQHTGRLFTAFTVIAILIAGLGLFGLAAYMAQQRTKEIGIRRVLGATVGSVLVLVSKEFLLLVGLAFLIAIPVTWWAMDEWLREFAYRTPVSWWIFPLAGGAALMIAIFTISFQAMRAATANPVRALRSE
ncbi:ABC transporter permease [Puia dinghuensis]|uniref:ABC transporter permease n=1 Tax=Puia dinghuensis TaxID=1792502 RepID=A0A8J2XUV0_9BACT|nr:ABC transporter permease [Puia dinghuensis]GGB14420.1 ABC transporter permease [Puia dinghuensis]